MSHSWLLYLDELIESGEKIQRFVADRTFASFSSDEIVFDAVLFNLQRIGVGIRKLPEEARAEIPELGNSLPAHIRDLIAHHYFGLDPEIVWQLVQIHVPKFLAQACALRHEVESGERSVVDEWE